MYKTILVHVDDTVRSAERVKAAGRLAAKYEAHLVGAATTGLAEYLIPIGGLDGGMPAIVFPIEELRAEADRALCKFQSTAESAGVHAFERRLIDDEASVGISLHARYSDLVVISRHVADEFMPRLRSDFPEYVLLNCARPVLVLPPHSPAGDIGRSVTVAWNGSPEAVRAITSAIPLLKRAHQVNLVVFNADKDPELHGDEPGADIALYLARHGVRVKVSAIRADCDEGEALLTFAANKHADLIVMGAFGHSRLREFVLGGMSRAMLASSPIALWMAH